MRARNGRGCIAQAARWRLVLLTGDPDEMRVSAEIWMVGQERYASCSMQGEKTAVKRLQMLAKTCGHLGLDSLSKACQAMAQTLNAPVSCCDLAGIAQDRAAGSNLQLHTRYIDFLLGFRSVCGLVAVSHCRFTPMTLHTRSDSRRPRFFRLED